MLIGLACKAGMFPLHGWLPKAHPVAPSPASALLSGNITKMGILFTVRVIFYSVGQEFLQETWVMDVLLCLSLFTVFMGSMLAFREKLLKKRLAYSTVSQTSYCLTGIYLLSGTALTGALMHVVFHSVIKNLLFLCAGAIIVQTGKKSVSELKGIGRIMPATMRCFTVAGLALVGIPPLSGFISKWYLAEGAIESGLPGFMYLVPVVLLISALLTAGYLLTVSADAFFGKTEEETARCPKSMYLLPPLIIGAILAVVLGIFPDPLTNFLERIVAGLF
jgi:multicomponent Na+:H+ antiporter subunit D